MENTNIYVEQPEVIQSSTNDQQYEVAEESNNTNAVTTDEVPEPPAPVKNGPLQEVLFSQNSFNFFQGSQIDMEAPHMDPAVVAVHQIAPPQAVNFTMNPYPPSPPHEEVSLPSVNGNEPHEISGPSVLISQVSPIPNAIPRTVPPVLAFVQHDFNPSPLRHSQIKFRCDAEYDYAVRLCPSDNASWPSSSSYSTECCGTCGASNHHCSNPCYAHACTSYCSGSRGKCSNSNRTKTRNYTLSKKILKIYG
ncbi:hypothetical protein AVEN_268583-1 [Araneus ventricosus]|uniref:Uncharacterized protein n=1 Tax=Araneus ventricosus TaxID=182803 RepID=A0A4Y2C5N2_ARAVE|nr:hypothetical protein AVEN_268583-1 [Araneus ventricosus]